MQDEEEVESINKVTSIETVAEHEFSRFGSKFL